MYDRTTWTEVKRDSVNESSACISTLDKQVARIIKIDIWVGLDNLQR